MGLAGRLEGIAPSDIFQIISQGRMTGTLIARCPEGTAMVVFKNGQVIEAASDEPRESLGNLLVSQGIMPEETLEAARERRKMEPDRPLGAILLDMGAISDQALESIVRRQIEHIVHRLVSCEDGFLTFDSGETALNRKLNTHEFLLPSGVSAEYLMMERARVLDEERRKGSDRRRPQAPGPSTGGEPVGEQAGGDAATGKGFTDYAGGLLRRSSEFLGNAFARIRAFSPDGRMMIYAGVAATAAGIALILLTTLSFRPETTGSVLVVSRSLVNIRAKPSGDGKVIARLVQGDKMSYITSIEGWHKVRMKDGGIGWVSQKTAERKDIKSTVLKYDMKGFELVLAAGLSLLVVGLMRRRSAAQTAQQTGQPES